MVCCHSDKLGANLQQVQRKADQGRGSDTKNVKIRVLQMIPPDYLPDADVPGIRKVASAYVNECNDPEDKKFWRGFNHAVTARLLRPARYLETYKRDPEGYARSSHRRVCILTTHRTRRSLRSRTLGLIDREGYPFLPVVLYDEKMMNGSMTKGLFRGPLLLRASSPPSEDNR